MARSSIIIALQWHAELHPNELSVNKHGLLSFATKLGGYLNGKWPRSVCIHTVLSVSQYSAQRCAETVTCPIGRLCTHADVQYVHTHWPTN